MKVSVHFINVCPLKKPIFQPLWHATLPSWSHFEHSGTKMGSPDNEPLYWTLYLSIISTCSTSKFHLKMSQCSAWGVVMPMTNLYAKDCMLTEAKSLLARWLPCYKEPLLTQPEKRMQPTMQKIGVISPLETYCTVAFKSRGSYIIFCLSMRLLFEGGFYSRAAFIQGRLLFF